MTVGMRQYHRSQNIGRNIYMIIEIGSQQSYRIITNKSKREIPSPNEGA